MRKQPSMFKLLLILPIVVPCLGISDDNQGLTEQESNMGWPQAIATAIFLNPNIGGFAGSFVTRQAIPEWYNKVLVKPSWRAPNWAFRWVWTLLYTSMAYSSYVVWKDLGGPNLLDVTSLPPPIQLYVLQLTLNWILIPIFFGAKNLTGALVIILALDAMVVVTTASFLKVDTISGLLLVPYIGWLSFSTGLITSIWLNNPDYRLGPPKAHKTK